MLSTNGQSNGVPPIGGEQDVSDDYDTVCKDCRRAVDELGAINSVVCDLLCGRKEKERALFDIAES